MSAAPLGGAAPGAATGQAGLMAGSPHVVVLAPMPLELDAVVKAFGLAEAGDGHRGKLGGAEVRAVHIGMGPSLAEQATEALFADGAPDHVMIAGIAGGLDPALEIGAVINPASVLDHRSGAGFEHRQPGSAGGRGVLITTETVILDPVVLSGFRADGVIAADMETAAVAAVCARHGCPWSVYRSISDRPQDGILDESFLAMMEPDGSPDLAEAERRLREDPTLAAKMEQLGRDCALAADRAAEAAAAACALLGA